jgi:hypothetical protein
MKHFITLILIMICVAPGFPVSVQAANSPDDGANCRKHGRGMDCDVRQGSPPPEVTCTPEMRGRCGKRRGDWYGARRPVQSPAEALEQLRNYFSGRDYTIPGVDEKKWGFKADIVDQDGTIVDRVLIDKRTGRIRSIY